MPTKEKVVIVGDGGQASVLIDIIEDEGRYQIIGLTSKTQSEGRSVKGYPILGDDSILPGLWEQGIRKVALGIGGYRSNMLRKKIFTELKEKGFEIINAIHPTCFISKYATLGEGVVMYPHATVLTDAHIGNNVIMALCSTVGHGTVIEDHVLLSANVNIGADVRVGTCTLVGIGAKVVSGVNIGKEVLIAAGSIVTSEIQDNKTVYGIPAKEKVKSTLEE